jgi:CO dehydrogenase maturation factor
LQLKTITDINCLVEISFAGKGGSGKTSLASLFTSHLAATGRPVPALDADINQHLAPPLAPTSASR